MDEVTGYVVVRVSAMDGGVTLMDEPTEFDPLLTSRQVATRLGISPAGWRQLVTRGVAPAADVPGRVARWHESSIEVFERRRKRPGRPRKVPGE